jgi:lipopolysaccharide export system permease protein
VYSMRQLNIAIDSIKKDNRRLAEQLQRGMYDALKFNKYVDSSRKKSAVTETKAETAKRVILDTSIKKFDQLIPDSIRSSVNGLALNYISSLQSGIASMEQTLKERERMLRKHKIEWHRKIVLSLSCLIFFLIGAPLGSIIRKGGLGTPLIAAIAFFMVFYFSAATGERFAKEGSITPFVGMWMPIFILLPISIFLIYKAMKDSQLFNKEWYYRMAKPLRKAWERRTRNKLSVEKS